MVVSEAIYESEVVKVKGQKLFLANRAKSSGANYVQGSVALSQLLFALEDWEKNESCTLPFSMKKSESNTGTKNI